MGWPKDQFNPAQFFLGFCVYSILIMGWLHEFFHLACAQTFGGEAHVIGNLFVFATDITVWPTDPSAQIFTVYIGGWGVALICWFLWSQTTDIENRIILHAVGCSQFLYGTVEGTAWMLDRYADVGWMGLIAFLLGTAYALARSKEMWKAEA